METNTPWPSAPAADEPPPADSPEDDQDGDLAELERRWWSKQLGSS